MTVALPDTAHALTVLVVDEKGQPVPNAQVTLDTQGSQQTYQYSDSDGRVRYAGVFASEVTLRASKDGYARARASEVHLTSASDDVKIVLEHGLQVHVSIIDAHSRPVTGGHLNVMDPQIMTGWNTRETGAGQYTLVDLPGHEIELQYGLAGRQYKVLHDPHKAEARIEVPVHGQLVVTWTVSADRRHLVEVRPVDTTLYAVQSASSIQHAGETRFDYVLPGEYDVVLVEDPLGDAKGTVLDSRRITVQADGTARIALGP